MIHACRRHDVAPSRRILVVSVADQAMRLFEKSPWQLTRHRFADYLFVREYVVSTSKFGIGQEEGSNKTPLGLHRVGEKIGGGHPIGTIFRERKPAGLTWGGEPDGMIVHRILWLDGLEAGFNRGGNVDTHRRYIYIHGFGDEMTLGRPASHGCIHMAARDLIPFYNQTPGGTLVWIGKTW
jgi:hypothetical protein